MSVAAAAWALSTGLAWAGPPISADAPRKVVPRDTGVVWNSCEGEPDAAPCDKWDPIASDPELALKDRLPELLPPLKFDYFGRNDCRAFPDKHPKRSLGLITHVVIHNGGFSARGNFETFTCRLGASHYTIERDGTVYQHMGEEWVAPHAEGPERNAFGEGINDKSIGIELNLPRRGGGSCNSLPANAKLDDVVDKCEPTDAQYRSLALLLKDIAARTSVVQDVNHVIGHCEMASPSGHGDPKAFDWDRVGISNEAKLQALLDRHAQGLEDACGWYLAYDGDGSVDRDLSGRGTVALLRRMKKDAAEEARK